MKVLMPKSVKTFYFFYAAIVAIALILFVIGAISSYPLFYLLTFTFAAYIPSFFFTIGFYRWKYYALVKKIISLIIGIALSALILYIFYLFTTAHEKDKIPLSSSLSFAVGCAPAISLVATFFACIIKAKYKTYFFMGIMFPFIFALICVGIELLTKTAIFGFIGTVFTVVVGIVLFNMISRAMTEESEDFYSNYIMDTNYRKYYHLYGKVYTDNNGHHFEYNRYRGTLEEI